MDTIEFFTDQARQCRDAARKAERREDRHGLEQLARHYEREAARLARPTSPAAFGTRHGARA